VPEIMDGSDVIIANGNRVDGALVDRGISHGPGFRHEAFLYASQEEFVDGAAPFLREGVAAGEPVLVVVSAPKIRLLQAALDRSAVAVHFLDMAEVGSNPARIIPAWQEFLDVRAEGGGPARGIGEPIWAARTPAQLVECQRHESLLNVAFADWPAFRLLCPYDTGALAPGVIDEAHRSHPWILDKGAYRESRTCRDRAGMSASHLDSPLPEPARRLDECSFGPGRLGSLRALVVRHARRFGLPSARTDELVVAVNEVATNSLRHGGGEGAFRLWREGQVLICEISDKGHLRHPLVGRVRPPSDVQGGRGLWMANQLCDLVQIRTSTAGTVVRLHMSLNPR
jgi:anti-sigma regulatory factor (Ser/Thr protein kinase)